MDIERDSSKQHHHCWWLYRQYVPVNLGSADWISHIMYIAWIFQIAGTLSMANGVQVTLLSGALAKNIVWVVSGAVTLGTTSHFEGILLAATSVTLGTGSTMTGRILAQSAVNLQKSTVKQPPN